MLPIPVSTPGFDSAPTLTATNVITRDPETGVQNMGTYRAALKAPDRLVVRMATRVGGAGGYQHYLKHQKRGDKTMPCAIVLGCPPYVAFMGPQKLPIDVDEIDVAGGLAGAPINVVKREDGRSAGARRGRDRDRGLDRHRIRRARRAVRRIARPRRARGIQHADARDGDHASQEAAIVASYISQVDAERIERDQARRLRAAVSRAPAHDARHPRREARVAARAADGACCASRSITVEKGTPRTEIWRALYGAAFFKARLRQDLHRGQRRHRSRQRRRATSGRWRIRMNPVEDVAVLPHRGQGHGPKREQRARRKTRRC